MGVVIPLFLVTGSAARRPGDEESLQVVAALARIDSLLAAEEPSLALERALALATRYPDHPRYGGGIEARTGVGFLRTARPAEALPHLERAVQGEPNNPAYHRNLGSALLALGRKGRALSEYAQAVELAPREFTYRLEYGQLLLDFGDRRRARTHLLTARQLCGDCPEIQIPLVRYYLAAGLFEPAVDILQPLVAQGQGGAVRRSLIQALQGAGRDSLLVEVLSGTPREEMPADEARLLVETEGRLGQTHWSMIWAQTENAAPPSVAGDGLFWGHVSQNLLRAGDNPAALRALNRALTLDPDNIVYLNNRVVLLTRLGRHDEAAREWEKVLEKDPSLKERQGK